MLVFSVSDSLPQFDYAASRYVLKSSDARVSTISDGLYFKYKFQPEGLTTESDSISVLHLVITAIVCFGCTLALCGKRHGMALAVDLVLRFVLKDKSMNKRD